MNFETEANLLKKRMKEEARESWPESSDTKVSIYLIES